LTVAFWVSAQNQTKQQIPDKRLTSVPGELLVRFRPTSELAKLKGKSSVSLRLVFRGKTLPIQIEDFGGSDLVEGLMLGHVSPAETLDAMIALQMRSDVVYVEPNFVRYIDAVPNDPQYVDQFALKNSAPGGAGISAESAWDTTTGNHSVVVGVIDSGIDINHLDLKDNIFVNTAEIANNGVDDDNNGKVDDVNGWDFFNNDKTVFDNANDDAHGTHVAGTIGARGNNAIGIAGVNWDVQLMPLKALGPDGGSDATILQAYAYAKMMRQRGVNLRVLNNSYGNQGFSQALRDGVKELGDIGILFVAAAGNETTNNDFIPQFPASFDLPNVISVAAS
ncbi:MAG TPA: S8 family peptidase, partial [Pyrinomonadaceae bacterium]